MDRSAVRLHSHAARGNEQLGRQVPLPVAIPQMAAGPEDSPLFFKPEVNRMSRRLTTPSLALPVRGRSHYCWRRPGAHRPNRWILFAVFCAILFALPGCTSWRKVKGTFSTADGQPLVIGRGAEQVKLVPGPLVVGFSFGLKKIKFPGPSRPMEVHASAAARSGGVIMFPATETGLSVDLIASNASRASATRSLRQTSEPCDCYEVAESYKLPCKDPTGASCPEYTLDSIKCHGTKPVEQGVRSFSRSYQVDFVPPGAKSPTLGRFSGGGGGSSLVLGQEDRGSCVSHPY